MSWGHTPTPGLGGSGGTSQQLSLSSRGWKREALRDALGRQQLFSARLLDQIGEPAAGAVGPVATRLQDGSAADLRAAYAGSPPAFRARLEAQLGKEGLEELFSIAQNSDPFCYLTQLQHFGLRLKRRPGPAAALVMRELAAGATTLLGSPEEKARAKDIVQRAQLELQVLEGSGPLGLRLEYLGSRFVEEATDPWMLVGFGVAGMAYKTTRLATLSRLLAKPSWLARGPVASLLASGAGLGVETPSFVFVTKAGHQLSGAPQDWSPQTLQREILATGMTLFFLKGAGALSTQAFHRLHGIDPVLHLPSRLPGMTKFSQAILPEAGMLGGIMLGHRVEQVAGLRPEVPGSNPLAEGLVTLLQFKVAGSLSDRLWGPRFHAWQRELEIRPQQLKTQQGKTSTLESLGLNLQPSWGSQGLSRGLGKLGTDPKLQHLSLMTQGGDEGEGGKILRLPNAGTNLDGTPRREATGSVLEPAEAKEYIERSLEASRGLLKEIRRDLYELIMQSRVYAGHLGAGRGWLEAVDLMGKATGHQLIRSQEALNKVDEHAKKLEASIFLSHQDPEVLLQVAATREELQELRHRLPGLRGHLGRLHQAIHQPERIDLDSTVDALLRQYARTFLDTEFPAQRDQSLKWERLLTQVEGMLFGISLKEVFRGSHLQFNSPREFDYGLVSGLLEDLHNPDLGPDLFHVLMARRPASGSATQIREVLSRGGRPEDPFRGWISVHLPTLIGAHQGQFELTYRKLAPLLPLMSPETQAATHLAGWWLAKTLNGNGDPREWGVEYEDLPAKPDFSISLSEAGRDLVAVRTALDIFLGSPFDPETAIRRALETPKEVREDTASLVGALMGGFHGMGHVPNRWLAQQLMTHYPEKTPEAIAKRLQSLEIRHRDFTKAFRSMGNLWQSEPVMAGRQRNLFLLSSLDRLLPKETRAVGSEAQDLLRQDLVRIRDFLARGTAGPLHPSRLRDFVTANGDSLEAWEQLRSKILRSRDDEAFLDAPSRDKLGREVRVLAEHLRSLNTILHPYRNRRRTMRLSKGDLQAIHDQQVALQALLKGPTRSEPPPGETHFLSLGDLVLGEEKARQKPGNLVSLDELRARRSSKDLLAEHSSVAKDVFTIEVGDWFDPESHLGKVTAFWAEWAKGAGETVTPEAGQAVQNRLKQWPGYFRQEMAFFAATNPTLAKVLLVKFGLLPEGSKLGQDPEVVSELGKKSRDELPEEELERLTDFLISNYQWAAASHYRETYEAVAEAEKAEWKRRTAELPPILLTALTGGGLTTAQILLFMNKLGFVKIDIPPYSEIPERPD